MPANPWEYFWPGIIAAQAIHVAAKLGIADLLAAGSKTIADLAAESARTQPRSSACCVRWALSKCSHPPPMAAFATRR
jgi:hypothetical protein